MPSLCTLSIAALFVLATLGCSPGASPSKQISASPTPEPTPEATAEPLVGGIQE